ncbi:MAG: radical SAM protein, partial [Oscillospiraceae bacterium]|nr:radical SAM protein [Oscillospiraceae bacterium]
MAAFDLEQYLAQGVRHILTGLTAAAGKNIKTAAFLARFAPAAQSAKHRRAQLAAAGEHIPPFLIVSITEQCNLHCRGCYARAGGVCCDGGADDVLTAAQWADLFTQAVELGVSFILLAGGEPLLRPDVLAAAAREKRIIFPVFTNGTLFSPDACALFLQNRNLMPVLSLEGDAAATDARRGSGVYRRLQDAMALLHKNGVLFGASI